MIGKLVPVLLLSVLAACAASSSHAAPRLPLAIEATPKGDGDLRVRVTLAEPPKDAPVIEASVTGRGKVQFYNTTAAGDAYEADIPVTAGDMLMLVVRADGETAMFLVNTEPLITGETMFTASANGQLNFVVPPDAFPKGTWLTFAPTANVEPPPGRIFVREPQRIAASTDGDALQGIAEVHFGLPDRQEGGAHADFDPATVRIERYDAESETWEPLKTSFEQAPLTGGYFAETSRLGIYALTASPK